MSRNFCHPHGRRFFIQEENVSMTVAVLSEKTAEDAHAIIIAARIEMDKRLFARRIAGVDRGNIILFRLDSHKLLDNGFVFHEYHQRDARNPKIPRYLG